jgi:hypothetical protein
MISLNSISGLVSLAPTPMVLSCKKYSGACAILCHEINTLKKKAESYFGERTKKHVDGLLKSAP